MLWSTWNRPGAFLTDMGGEFGVGGAGVDVDRLWGEGDDAVELIGGDQFTLTLVPRLEHLLRWGAAQNAWMDESSKFDMGDMSAGAIDALKVPDGFCAVWPKFSIIDLRMRVKGVK